MTPDVKPRHEVMRLAQVIEQRLIANDHTEGAAMPPSLDACPMCGSDEIASDDELAARDLWPTMIGSEAWRNKQERLTASNAAAHAAILKVRT